MSEPTPPCDFCRLDAQYRIEFFSHIRQQGPAMYACARCLEQSARLTDLLARAVRVRLTSLATGKHAMGAPTDIHRLLQNLEPTGRFRTITSAVRITASAEKDLGLRCSRCRKAITGDTPGALAWSIRPDGQRQALRVYHLDCLPEDAVFGKTCIELERIGSLDEARFTPAAREILRHVRRMADRGA